MNPKIIIIIIFINISPVPAKLPSLSISSSNIFFLFSLPFHINFFRIAAAHAQRAMLSLHSSQAVFFGWSLVYVVSICIVDAFSDGLRVPFLHTEWLCWLILALVAKSTQNSTRFIQHDDRNYADKLALAVAALGLCWTFGDARWAVVRQHPPSFDPPHTFFSILRFPMRQP